MLERAHLTILREVDRQGSMTAAAQVLCLTQSALSHAMRKVEDLLGVDVWLREGRSLRLTQAGEFLLEVANRVLPQLENAEHNLQQHARGVRGSLRVGMECHPCYQWLQKVVAVFLPRWPDVDVDVKQKFRFGGLGALLDHEIDLLVTPDPEQRAGLTFEPVFDYEQVLVVPRSHVLATARHVEPPALAAEVLITYPVDNSRLDIYNLFLTPAGINPRLHKVVESTDLMLQMVASGRGVAALPRWLVSEFASRMNLSAVRLGRGGIRKHIYLGTRTMDAGTAYLDAFVATARHLGSATGTPHAKASAPNAKTRRPRMIGSGALAAPVAQSGRKLENR